MPNKYYILAALILGLFLSADSFSQTFYGTIEQKEFYEGRDKEFRDKETSPLKEEDFAEFNGLNYYSIDDKYRLTAVLTKTNSKEYFLMPTSSDKVQKYIKYAVLTFEIDKTAYKLNVYQADEAVRRAFPEYKDLLFIPFKDLTNGSESYAGGRYLYILDTDKTEIILDFNLASNPSCAYGSDKYSCPIPPRENYLKVGIKAGEKIYHTKSNK